MLTIPARRLLPGDVLTHPDHESARPETVLTVQDTGDGTEVTTSKTLACHAMPLFLRYSDSVIIEGTD